ncbi:hypothetical protein C8R46DRAFT_1305275 [Mycena filopes]|nr:hypothetical protein C8R46DRAFT_1305275 [Mycena filopes]
MHASLQVQRFSGLSASDRGVATAAMDGSLSHLREAVRRVTDGSRDIRFLPLFYHYLDPARIPTSAEMDVPTLPEPTTKTVTQAFLSLQALCNLGTLLPRKAAPDLWQRLWPWVGFFDVHHSSIVDAPSEDVVRAYCFIPISYLMEIKSPTSGLILSTPGIGILVGQTWGTYFRDPCAATELTLRNICHLLLISRQFRTINFMEVVEGAGGFSALAILVTQMVDYLLVNAPTVDRKATYLLSIMNFCGQCKDPAWIAAQAAHKVLTAATLVLLFADSVFDQTSDPPELHPELLKHSWNVFLPLVLHGDGYARQLEAITAGALAFFVSHTQKCMDWGRSRLETLITLILLPVTLYHAVLSAIEAALPALEGVTSTAAFTTSSLYPVWHEFVALAAERIQIKNRVEREDHVSYKACDNLHCAKVLPKSSFKRCSGCEYLHYCCKECQIRDWRDGGHRTRCAITRPADGWYVSHLDGPSFCSARDRALIRAIVRHDYEAQKEHIFLSRIVQMREHGLGIMTIWDYSSGRAEATVAADPNYTGNRDWASRARRSGAKMYVNYFEPGGWILPLRANNGEINRGLSVVARSLPQGTVEATVSAEVMTTVKKLVELSRSVVEVI